MNKIKYFVLALVVGILISVPCLGATLTVSPDKGKMTVGICKIADKTDEGYRLCDGFDGSGLSVNAIVAELNAVNADAAYKFINDNDLPIVSAMCDGGNVVFDDVTNGIWLAFCLDGTRSFSPFFAFVDGDFTASPKTSPYLPDTRAVTVIKKWDDNNNETGQRPRSVTVELLVDGIVTATATLDASVGWSYTFEGVAAEGAVTVREKAVAQYKPSYNGDVSNGIVITNTLESASKLPQTGQLLWPVTVLGIAGVMFILLGIIELRGKRNEKK